jgi:hypothetical protein
MAEAATAIKSGPKTYSLPLGQAYIKGRISGSRRWKSAERGVSFFTVLRIPAPDEFSYPGVVELMSTRPLGQSGEDWEGIVEVTGMGNNFETKPDPQTGEILQVKSARNWLRVVE